MHTTAFVDNKETMPEKQYEGVLERCQSLEMRDTFLKYQGYKHFHTNEESENMANYISSTECVRDLDNLIRRNYNMDPPLHDQIPKNLSGRKRDVYSWKGNFKYLLKLIAFAMRDFDSIYSDGVYSFRTSRTAQDFLRLLRDNEHRSDCYIVKADITNYVGSIIPEKIIPILERIWGADPALLDLMKFLLLRRECIEPDGETVTCETGGLGGIPLANIFMNVYLMELDDFFYPRVPLYCRYSDDLIILAENREDAEYYLNHLLQVFKEKGVSTNPEKTYLIEPGEEVEILGCKLKDGKMDISDHAKKKLKRKIRMHVNFLLKTRREQGLTAEECGRRMAGYCNKVFFGQRRKNELTWARWLFPVITETASLKELDHFVQDAIRYCMCGTLKNKRYRITYQELKELGYKSLVHSYYHFKYTVD